MEAKSTIKLKNELAEVERFGDILTEFLNSLNLSPSFVNELNLVFDEIITNIIEHGYIDAEEHFIDINLSVRENVFSAKIEDDGIEFNPLTSLKDDRNLPLQDRSIGGLGIHIIKNYTDNVHYERQHGKNILTVSRKIILENN